MSEYIRVAAITALNLEVMQHKCILGEDEYAFYAKIRFFFWLPFLLFGTLGLVGSIHALRTAKSSSETDSEALRSRLANTGCGLFNFLCASPQSFPSTRPGWHASLLTLRAHCQRYPPMISTSWLVFNCEELSDGTARLLPAPHLNCYDDRWTEARIYATLTLIVWGVLFPVGLACLLSHFRSSLRTADFSRKFSLLTFGYKRECSWWEVSAMLKKFLLSGCIVLFRNHPSLQSVLPLTLLLVSVGLTIGFRPFYNPLLSFALILGEVTSPFAVEAKWKTKSSSCLLADHVFPGAGIWAAAPHCN